jgi:tetratricopeptide (TPR) repeat protein
MAVDSQLVASGLRLHQSGQFSQAYELYCQALVTDPSDAHLHSLLGAVCINLSRWEEAARYLDEALRLNPLNHAAHDNRGVLLASEGRFAEAIESFQRAVALNPQGSGPRMNLAAALARAGRHEDAIAAYRRAIELVPDLSRAHSELAGLLKSTGRLPEAAFHLGEVARLNPQDARAPFEWALVLMQLGRIDEAMAQYRETLRRDPKSVGAYVNLANLCGERKKYDEAAALFDRALALKPDFAEAHANLATVLTRQGQIAEAIRALEQAIRLKPQMAEAHNNLGIAYGEQANFSQASASYRRALELKPEDPDTLYNLGIALLKQKQVAEAISHFNRAIAAKPDYAEAHHNLSAALLLDEDYQRGLAEYEWRFGSRDFPPARFRWPRWDGSPPSGRTIVLCSEQGLGDTIQFVRYAPMVQAQGASVIVECQAALHAILARTAGVDTWISTKGDPPQADCCAPMMSLPHLLGTTYATIPASVPYVFADPHLVDVWRKTLGDLGLGRLKVGIAWQGNPKCPGDAWRSIPLTALAPLAQVKGVRLVNLQKGPGVEQVDAVKDSRPIVDFGPDIDTTAGAFMDTAAIMKNLDLVITSDTATAHLAGALGVPVWVALPYVPDWRWGLDRDDCLWYPTMRLFRQSEWGRWDNVFERMADALDSFAGLG